MGPEILIPISFFISASWIVKTVLRYKERRLELESGGLQHGARDVSARLERIEQAIDAMALEVERISEGQRFTTRLLAERGSDASVRQLPPL